MEALKSGRFSLSRTGGVAGAEEKPSPPPLPPRKPFSWDEIFVLTAASLVGCVGLACWVYHSCGRWLKEKLFLLLLRCKAASRRALRAVCGTSADTI